MQSATRSLPAPSDVVAEREADRKRQQERSRRKCLAPACARIVSLAPDPNPSASGADPDSGPQLVFTPPTLYCSEKCVRDYVQHTIERIRADRAARSRKPLSVRVIPAEENLSNGFVFRVSRIHVLIICILHASQAVTAEMLEKERVMLVDMRSGTLHSGLTSPRLELETLSKLLANNRTLSILVSGSGSGTGAASGTAGQKAGSRDAKSSATARSAHPTVAPPKRTLAPAPPFVPALDRSKAMSARGARAPQPTSGASKAPPTPNSISASTPKQQLQLQHSRPPAAEQLSASSSQNFPLRVKIRTMLLELLNKRSADEI